MKRKNNFGILALLLGCVMTSYAVPSPMTSATIKPDQPYMQEAIRDLENAKRELQQAARNKGGHRMTAINLINRAIGEIRRGINFDRRHDAHASRLPAADQPNMRAALDHLKSAQKNLQRATADKGGHRANALNLVAQAIAEVNRGIDAAN